MIKKSIFVILCSDIIILIAAYYTAHLIRLDLIIPDRFWTLFVRYLPLGTFAEEQDSEQVKLELKQIVPEYDSKAGAGPGHPPSSQ